MTKNVQDARLYAFCILPDHVHILVGLGEQGLSKFMQSFKCNSSRDLRRFLLTRSSDAGVAAAIENVHWQKGYYDEHIMDNRQRGSVFRYIQNNPIHHNIVKNINEWPWTSLHFPDLMDEMEIWFD